MDLYEGEKDKSLQFIDESRKSSVISLREESQRVNLKQLERKRRYFRIKTFTFRCRSKRYFQKSNKVFQSVDLTK